MQTIDYKKQARDFLAKHDLIFWAIRVDDSCPPWCDDARHIHGDRHIIGLKRRESKAAITFPFWDSYHDAHKPLWERRLPGPYDVLACISGDVNCPNKFTEFCSEYDYDSDSRKALNTFRRRSRLARKLNKFFKPEEIADLVEIA